MKYINTDTAIVTVQGASKQSRKEYNQVNYTQQSVDLHT